VALRKELLALDGGHTSVAALSIPRAMSELMLTVETARACRRHLDDAGTLQNACSTALPRRPHGLRIRAGIWRSTGLGKVTFRSAATGSSGYATSPPASCAASASPSLSAAE